MEAANLQMSTMVQCSCGQFFVWFVAWPWKDSTDTIKWAIRNIPSGQQRWMYQYFFKSTSLSFSEKKVGIMSIISFFFFFLTSGGKGSYYFSFSKIGFPITQFAHQNDGMAIDRDKGHVRRNPWGPLLSQLCHILLQQLSHMASKFSTLEACFYLLNGF